MSYELGAAMSSSSRSSEECGSRHQESCTYRRFETIEEKCLPKQRFFYEKEKNRKLRFTVEFLRFSSLGWPVFARSYGTPGCTANISVIGHREHRCER